MTQLKIVSKLDPSTVVRSIIVELTKKSCAASLTILSWFNAFFYSEVDSAFFFFFFLSINYSIRKGILLLLCIFTTLTHTNKKQKTKQILANCRMSDPIKTISRYFCTSCICFCTCEGCLNYKNMLSPYISSMLFALLFHTT